MTECNREVVSFSSVGRRSLVADFLGGQITSDAGGLLLREADRQLGMTLALAQCVADPRDPARTVHSTLRMIRQRVYGLALGYEDLNDHDTLRRDELFKVLAEADEDMASSPTLCRFENRVDRAALWKMSAALVEVFVASHRRPPDELVLDFDATDDEVHGRQEGRFFHGYYDHYCFLPLYVFCGGQLLVAYLRPSNIDASRHSRGILGMLVGRLRQAWPGVRITIRGDSGFCRWRLMRWCDRHRVNYILGLARNSVLEGLAAPLMKQAAEAFAATGEKQRLFGEVSYAAGTWDKQRRVLIKAEHLKDGPNPRFVVTDLAGEPQHLYDEVYCQRGEMENRIKEQQLALFADRTSAHRFVANQLRLLLAAAAYVLVEHIRRVGLAGTELADAQCGTIRLKLFKIGAQIQRSFRRVVLHMASGYPYAALLATVVARLVPT